MAAPVNAIFFFSMNFCEGLAFLFLTDGPAKKVLQEGASCPLKNVRVLFGKRKGGKECLDQSL